MTDRKKLREQADGYREAAANVRARIAEMDALWEKHSDTIANALADASADEPEDTTA